MWSLFVVVPDPAIYHNSGLAQRLEAMLPDALLLQGSEEALHESVLFRCIRRRELLGETIGLHRARVVPAAEDQAVDALLSVKEQIQAICV